MKKDDIKTLIIVIIICSIFIGILLIFGRKKASDELTPVTEYPAYFSVNSFINKYLSSISDEDSKATYNMLTEQYIDNNEITESNIFDKINIYPTGTSLKIMNMSYVKKSNDYIYLIEGNLIQNTYEKQVLLEDDYKLIVLNDMENMTMSIFPVDNNNPKKIIDKRRKIDIVENEHNQMQGTGIINKERICSLYLSDFVSKLNSNVEDAYKLLDKKMTNKYQTLDSFKKYLGENKDIMNSKADKCRMDGTDEHRKYIVLDSNNNKYEFNEKSVMNYKVTITLND